jgi:hypothetical protein
MAMDETFKLLLLKQLEDIKALAIKNRRQTSVPRSGKGSSRLPIWFELNRSTEDDLIKLPGRITDHDGIRALRRIHLLEALSAFCPAWVALQEERADELNRQFSRIEQNLGAVEGLSELSVMNSVVASQKGFLSHVERRNPKKERILAIYRREIPPTLSASRAANIIFQRYPDMETLCSIKTAAKWISAERKRVAAQSNDASPSD